MTVEFAELIGCDLADEARARAEGGDASGGIPRRSTANLVRRSHVRIEPLGLLGIDQAHRPFDKALVARKSSLASAITSTMALPMHRHRGSVRAWNLQQIEESAPPSGPFNSAATLPRRMGARHRDPMRRLLFASALILAGCATKPEPAPSPQQPCAGCAGEAPDYPADGHDDERPDRSLRPARLQVQEGTSLKLQFRGRYCVLDAYLYPGQNGVMRVTHVDTRNTSGADVDQATCISALEYPS